MKSLPLAVYCALGVAIAGCASTSKPRSPPPLEWPGESTAAGAGASDPKAGHAPKEPRLPQTYGDGSGSRPDDSAEDAEADRDEDAEREKAGDADEAEPDETAEPYEDDAAEDEAEVDPEAEPEDEPEDEPEEDYPDDEPWEAMAGQARLVHVVRGAA